MEYKKQHYIPQSYLASWADPGTPSGYEPYVWLIDKTTFKAKNRAPKNIFFEKDFYTMENDEGERDVTLEKILSKIESKFVQVRDNVIKNHHPINLSDRIHLITFMAAMHSRTPTSGERFQAGWQGILGKMKEIREKMSNSDIESIPYPIVDIGSCEIVSIDEVQEIVDNPITSLLGQSILIEVKNLLKLDLAIICTKTSPGYITSDNPVVWVDPKRHKRPTAYQGVGLAYPTIEISMPITPFHNLFINRQGVSGYVDLSEFKPNIELETINRANRRAIKYSKKFLVVNQEKLLWEWFLHL